MPEYLTYSEIADRLGVGIDTVRRSVKRLSKTYNIRVHSDLWYSVPPTKGGHRYGNVTLLRSTDAPDRGARFDQSHGERV